MMLNVFVMMLAATPPGSWIDYVSGRGAFTVCHPVEMRTQGGGMDGMSVRFISRDGGDLSASGYSGTQTLRDAMRLELEEYSSKQARVSYLSQTASWAVASGVSGKDEFYIKVIRGSDRYITVNLKYPAVKHAKYSVFASKLNKCFRPNLPDF